MTIEKRQSKRLSIQCNAHVRYRDNRAFAVQVSNLNLDGMFLKTQNLQIGRSTILGVEFALGGRQWHISCLVVHSSHKGLGVMFDLPQPELYHLAKTIQQIDPAMAAASLAARPMAKAHP